MIIKFKSLTLQNFKSHRDLTVEFGDTTQISGDNAKGKSSISEAITFLLYGTDTLGSKMDPTPVTYEADETMVSLLLNVDGKDLMLGREMKKGKAKYYINEVPSKATEFNEILDQLFDKDLFFSLFNPNYFFTLHWEKQRSMILQYTTAPANKEVIAELAKLAKPQADKLSVLVKKHSLADLEKIHRDNKNKKDKEYIAAQSRTKTLQEQLQQFGSLVPLDSLNIELNQLVKERDEKEKITDESGDVNSRIRVLQSQVDGLTQQIDRGREEHTALKDRAINTDCHACGQELTDIAKEVAEQSKDDALKAIAQRINPLIAQRKAVREELATLTPIEVSNDLREELRAIQSKIVELKRESDKHKQIGYLDANIESAKTSENEIKESLNESIFILDSIKAFNAKEAELQAAKVQGLFENLSIKLFETVKTTGEMKPTFEIMMDGKEYKKLSLSESIKAGLELRDVLSEQSNIVAPCFVDNSESITKFKEPNGQLIMAKVVAGQELKIEGDK